MRRILSQFRFSLSSKHFIELEEKYGCHNYHPIPVVIAKAKGRLVPKARPICLGPGGQEVHGLSRRILRREPRALPRQNLPSPRRPGPDSYPDL